MVSGWWFGTWLLFFHFIYGMSSFPLTNNYFSRWLKPPTRSTVVFFSPFFDHFPAGFTVQSLLGLKPWTTTGAATRLVRGRRTNCLAGEIGGGSKSPSWIQSMYDDVSILFYIQKWSGFKWMNMGQLDPQICFFPCQDALSVANLLTCPEEDQLATRRQRCDLAVNCNVFRK